MRTQRTRTLLDRSGWVGFLIVGWTFIFPIFGIPNIVDAYRDGALKTGPAVIMAVLWVVSAAISAAHWRVNKGQSGVIDYNHGRESDGRD